MTTPYEVAQQYVGSAAQSDPRLRAFLNGDPQTPVDYAYCARFVNQAIQQSGGKGTGSDMARSFTSWGSPVKPGDYHPGDVAVYARPGGGPDAGHVGFIDHVNPDGSIALLGGNQGGGRVSVSDRYTQPIAVRRGETSMGPFDFNAAQPYADGAQPAYGQGATEAFMSAPLPAQSYQDNGFRDAPSYPGVYPTTAMRADDQYGPASRQSGQQDQKDKKSLISAGDAITDNSIQGMQFKGYKGNGGYLNG